jgi:hypothetical protein
MKKAHFVEPIVRFLSYCSDTEPFANPHTRRIPLLRRTSRWTNVLPFSSGFNVDALQVCLRDSLLSERVFSQVGNADKDVKLPMRNYTAAA